MTTLSKTLYKDDVIHYPNLSTVLLVEDLLKNADKAVSREEIKRDLGGRVMHQTLNVILKYLEYSGKIVIGRKGIVWIYNPSRKLAEAIEKGVEH
ncbi:MAG: hypothetical protein NTY73_03025 [Candidatus Micrarchaeota archaeon]|nr:hypothetical protein [Candidatus Micrarchaeota archaeon]